MLRGLLRVTFPLLMLLAMQSAFAALDLELTQGMNAALPIAIVPFANEASVVVPGKTTLTKVITNDLTNSGQFRVITPGMFGEKPTRVSQIDFEYWRKQGANDILVGSLKPIGENNFQVSFQLVNIYSGVGDAKKKNPQQVLPKAVLLNGSFTVQESGLRDLAHHISDVIYQKLTGVRGIFSTKIAYVLVQRAQGKPTNYALEVADADGFNPQPLVMQNQPLMSPAWGPKGKRIAYVSFEGHRARIYIQNIQTGARKVVSQSPGINGAPAFSPDGRRLAVVLSKTGNPKIYVLNLDTRNLTQITRGYSIDTEPSWAPDGKSLLFTSNRGGGPQIYRYTFATHKVQRVSFNGKYNARSSFFPAGKFIVMMHRNNGVFSIAKEDVSTTRVSELTNGISAESPSIAPNGKMVLYATQFGGRGVLGAVSADGRIKLRLPAREGSVQEPAWSPFLS